MFLRAIRRWYFVGVGLAIIYNSSLQWFASVWAHHANLGRLAMTVVFIAAVLVVADGVVPNPGSEGG